MVQCIRSGRLLRRGLAGLVVASLASAGVLVPRTSSSLSAHAAESTQSATSASAQPLTIKSDKTTVTAGEAFDVTVTSPEEGTVQLYIDGATVGERTAVTAGTPTPISLTSTAVGAHTITARYFSDSGKNTLPDSTVEITTTESAAVKSNGTDTDNGTYSATINGVAYSAENPLTVNPGDTVTVAISRTEAESAYIIELGINPPTGFTYKQGTAQRTLDGVEAASVVGTLGEEWQINGTTTFFSGYKKPQWGSSGNPDTQSGYVGTHSTEKYTVDANKNLTVSAQFIATNDLQPGTYTFEAGVYKSKNSDELRSLVSVPGATIVVPPRDLPARVGELDAAYNPTAEKKDVTAQKSMTAVCTATDLPYVGSSTVNIPFSFDVSNPSYATVGDEFTVKIPPAQITVPGSIPYKYGIISGSATVNYAHSIKMDFALPDPSLAELVSATLGDGAEGLQGKAPTFERVTETGEKSDTGSILRLSGDGEIIGDTGASSANISGKRGMSVEVNGNDTIIHLPEISLTFKAVSAGRFTFALRPNAATVSDFEQPVTFAGNGSAVGQTLSVAIYCQTAKPTLTSFSIVNKGETPSTEDLNQPGDTEGDQPIVSAPSAKGSSTADLAWIIPLVLLVTGGVLGGIYWLIKRYAPQVLPF